MKFCAECGKEIRDGATLCPNCGFTVNGTVQESKTNFCSNCGAEIKDETAFCSNCGGALKTRWLVDPKHKRALQIVAKIFMIIACVRAVLFVGYSIFVALSVHNIEQAIGFILKLVDLYDLIDFINLIGANYRVIFSVAAAVHTITLFWLIPMAVHYFKSVAQQKPIGLPFKICTIIFVSPVAGAIMILSDCKITR